MRQFIKAASMLILAVILSLNTTLIAFADKGSITVNGHIEVSSEKYSVTYIANGGIGGNFVDSEITPEEAYEILSCNAAGFSKGGYKFTGWNTRAAGDGMAYAPGDTITLSKDMTLYAQWEREKASTSGSTIGGASDAVKSGDTLNMPLWCRILFTSLSIMLLLLWIDWRRRPKDKATHDM